MHFGRKHRRERRRDRRRDRREPEMTPELDLDFGPGEWDEEPPKDWLKEEPENPYPRYVNAHTNPLNRALLG